MGQQTKYGARCGTQEAVGGRWNSTDCWNNTPEARSEAHKLPLPAHEASRQAAELLGLTGVQLAEVLPPRIRTGRSSLASGATQVPQQLKTPTHLTSASRCSSGSSQNIGRLSSVRTPSTCSNTPSRPRLASQALEHLTSVDIDPSRIFGEGGGGPLAALSMCVPAATPQAGATGDGLVPMTRKLNTESVEKQLAAAFAGELAPHISACPLRLQVLVTAPRKTILQHPSINVCMTV